jgi:hypothetical protein
MTTSFKVDCLSGAANFAVGTPYTYKIALYLVASGASLDATTAAYTSVGEVVGTGYTAGGLGLTISQPPTSSGTPATTAFINFVNVTWGPGASFSADGALIYNATTGHSVAVLNFGSTKTVSGSTFIVQFPAAGTGAAIVQVS